METKYVAGLAEESTDLEGLVVPARPKLAISSNLPLNNVNAHEESTGARKYERSSAAKFFVDERERRRGECVNMRRREHDDFAEESGDTGADSEGHVAGAVNRQQAMNALEMKEWSEVRRKKKSKVAQPLDKLVVGATTHPPQRQHESENVLATAAAKGEELRHFDAEQAFLKVDIDEGINIEILEEYQEFPMAWCC